MKFAIRKRRQPPSGLHISHPESAYCFEPPVKILQNLNIGAVRPVQGLCGSLQKFKQIITAVLHQVLNRHMGQSNRSGQFIQSQAQAGSAGEGLSVLFHQSCSRTLRAGSDGGKSLEKRRLDCGVLLVTATAAVLLWIIFQNPLSFRVVLHKRGTVLILS